MAISPTDIELIRKIQKGEKDCLYMLYDRYSGALYGVILRMCKREDMAQDILQETFVKIWTKINQYDPLKGRFYTWSYRIARNTTLNTLRKNVSLIQTEDLSVYENKNDEEANTDYSHLNGVLKKLQPHHQRAIELVYFNGLTHNEAHKEMEVPLGTFKSYIRQALKQISEHYHKAAFLVVLYLETMAYG